MVITGMLNSAVYSGADGAAVETDDHTYSWSDVADRAAHAAGGLDALGMRPGDRIAVLSHNTIAFYDAYSALPWGSFVMTCLNTRWSVGEIMHAVDDSGARALLVDDAFGGLAEELRARCPSLAVLIAAGDERLDATWEDRKSVV